MESVIVKVVASAFSVYQFLIFIYILSSWVPAVRESKPLKIVGSIVEPYLSFFRKFIPPIAMIDISPIVALFALKYIRLFALFGLITLLNYF